MCPFPSTQMCCGTCTAVNQTRRRLKTRMYVNNLGCEMFSCQSAQFVPIYAASTEANPSPRVARQIYGMAVIWLGRVYWEYTNARPCLSTPLLGCNLG